MRRRIGIFWKYFIAYSLISSIVILVFSILINSIIQKRYQEISYKELKGYALLANKEFENAFNIPLSEADELARRVSRQTGFRVTFILPDGKVIGDSERKPEEMENHFDRPEFQVALSGEIGSSIRYSNTLKTKMSYVAIPIYEAGEIKGVVRLSIRSQILEIFAKSVSRSVILISVIIWIITLILTFLFSSLFSSSVNELVNLTRNYANGNFSKRGNIRSRDELSEINSGLNEMSRKLQFLFNQLQSQRDESNAIINSMTEGVLVLDENFYVRVANSSFKSMFSLGNDILNKSYIETLRLVSIKEMIDELISEGQVKGKRIEFGGKSIQGNGIVIKSDGKDTGKLVLVFHDVTADTQLERIKADFVANASHELRTP
ncbi:HAMP domain-containing protein, partial [Candidatus Poribacteria bacterium]|nr:HAMP domain-containing protein [Candidatus Poribacteria bacterium]